MMMVMMMMMMLMMMMIMMMMMMMMMIVRVEKCPGWGEPLRTKSYWTGDPHGYTSIGSLTEMARRSRQYAGVDDRMAQLQCKNFATARSECVAHEPPCERVLQWHWQRCCVVASAMESNWDGSAKTTSCTA